VRDHERAFVARRAHAQRHKQVDAAGCGVLGSVDALVADHLEGTRLLGVPEQPGRRQRPQEALHLPLELLPDRALGRLEHRPARAALDARHQQQQAPLRGE